MNSLLVIFFIIIAFVLLGVWLKSILSSKLLIDCFKSNNCIVYGRKGKGKDLLFQYVISKRRRPYLSNISYGGKYYHIDIKDLELGENTYHDFILGHIKKIPKNELFEGKDAYISDSGVYLPSQYDSTLYKVYPSLSITYAISRHLYNMNIHVNTQNLERVWKALREQGDKFILVKRNINLPFYRLVFFNVYDKKSTALQELEPLKVKRGLIKSKDYTDTRDKEYKAVNGLIKTGFIFVNKASIKYDTRIFEKYVFDKSNVNVLSRERLTSKSMLSRLSLWVHRLYKKLTKNISNILRSRKKKEENEK